MNKTKVVEFTYTKDSGEVSKRRGITLGYSSPKLALIADISNEGYTSYQLQNLKMILDVARRTYLDTVSDILDGWNIEQKTFKLAGITNEKEVLL